jgi:hypothetical protein
MPELVFDLATRADDAGLRRLLRENPLQGSISLSFEREPCYFDAAAIEGPFHQTIVAREVDTQEVIALGNRSIRPLFLNGKVQDIGYMGQLRVRSDYGRGLYLARGLAGGFRKYHELHQDGRTPFYLMSVIDDNLPAKRLLTSRLPGYPQAKEYARMFTYAIHPSRRKHIPELPHPLRLVRGNDQHTAEIVDCLNRNGARRQFAPYWTRETLFMADLSPSDFFLALNGDHVVGCLACWDQSTFKQTVVRGYSGSIGRWRRWINAAARFGLAPYLPEEGTCLRYSHACHLAVDRDDPVIFEALLRAIHDQARLRGDSYFMIGMTGSNPLKDIVMKYRPLIYPSQLYLTSWGDIHEITSTVDRDLIPAPEVALL